MTRVRCARYSFFFKSEVAQTFTVGPRDTVTLLPDCIELSGELSDGLAWRVEIRRDALAYYRMVEFWQEELTAEEKRLKALGLPRPTDDVEFR